MKHSMLFCLLALATGSLSMGCAAQADDSTQNVGSTEQALGVIYATRALMEDQATGAVLYDTTEHAGIKRAVFAWYMPDTIRVSSYVDVDGFTAYRLRIYFPDYITDVEVGTGIGDWVIDKHMEEGSIVLHLRPTEWYALDSSGGYNRRIFFPPSY